MLWNIIKWELELLEIFCFLQITAEMQEILVFFDSAQT